MLRRNRTEQSVRTSAPPALDDLHGWVLSLPWVVERPYSLGTPGVRSFAVDCEPLGQRQLWLITGWQRALEAAGNGVAVIVPTEVAEEIETSGRGRSLAPMPDRHALVALNGRALAGSADVEALVLTAYGYALS